MISDSLFFALLYSVIVGFALTFGGLYFMHLVTTWISSATSASSKHARMLKACHKVPATRVNMLTSGVKVSGRNYEQHTRSTYRYSYKGHTYHYVHRGETNPGDDVILFFLDNPASACLEEDLHTKPVSWTKYLVPLALIMSALLFTYFYPWMDLISAGVR